MTIVDENEDPRSDFYDQDIELRYPRRNRALTAELKRHQLSAASEPSLIGVKRLARGRPILTQQGVGRTMLLGGRLIGELSCAGSSAFRDRQVAVKTLSGLTRIRMIHQTEQPLSGYYFSLYAYSLPLIEDAFVGYCAVSTQPPNEATGPDVIWRGASGATHETAGQALTAARVAADDFLTKHVQTSSASPQGWPATEAMRALLRKMSDG